MSPASDPSRPSRPGLLGRLFRSFGGAPTDEPAPPPLFKRRPLPPPEPRGPGLPELDDIPREAPPPPDPARLPQLAVVAAEPPESPPPPAPLPPAQLQALARLRAMVSAGMLAEARALLAEQFAAREELRDATGAPVHLLEAYRLAAFEGAPAELQRLEPRLRPFLGAGDPVLEAIQARAALRRRDPAAARAAYRAAVLRAPDCAEALDWLRRNPVSPDGGTPAADLIAGTPPLLPPPPLPPDPAVLSMLPGGLPPGAPAHWRKDVAVRVGPSGPATDGEREAARDIPGATADEAALLLTDPADFARAQVLPEALLSFFALARASNPPLRLARLYAGREPWATTAMDSPHAAMLAVLFPGLRVVGAFDGAVRERTVVALDRALSDPDTGTLLGRLLPLLVQVMPEARARVFRAFGLPGSETPPRVAGRRPRALHLAPTPAAAFAATAREPLFRLLEQGGFEVASLDVATTGWGEQVRAVFGADLLFGVHGPWMTPVLWAHPAARILELFPPGVHRYETHVLAQACGLAYLGMEGRAAGGFVTQAGHRPGPPTPQAGGIVTDLPWELLNRALGVAQA